MGLWHDDEDEKKSAKMNRGNIFDGREEKNKDRKFNDTAFEGKYEKIATEKKKTILNQKHPSCQKKSNSRAGWGGCF